MSNQRKADLALVLVTLFWGVSYYLVNLCLAELQPMNLNAFRFLLAFLVLGPIFWKKLRNASRATLKYSVIIGALLVGVYAGATYGVAYTSISNAGFICALPVVFTPLLDFAVNRRKPGKKLAVALVMCTVGLALLTLNDQFRPASGDLICLVCAVCYAADMLVTGRMPAGCGGRADAAGVGAGGAAQTTPDPRHLGRGHLSGAVLLRCRLRDPVGGPAVHHRQPRGRDLHAGAGVFRHRGLLLRR